MQTLKKYVYLFSYISASHSLFFIWSPSVGFYLSICFPTTHTHSFSPSFSLYLSLSLISSRTQHKNTDTLRCTSPEISSGNEFGKCAKIMKQTYINMNVKAYSLTKKGHTSILAISIVTQAFMSVMCRFFPILYMYIFESNNSTYEYCWTWGIMELSVIQFEMR